MNVRERKLVRLFSSLSSSDADTLLTFAEFLASRREPATEPVSKPQLEPRPQEETVVAAIQRLSRAYHMLDKSKVLHETSGLMSQHLLQGREASAVIDELEDLFQRHYKAMLE